MAGKRHRSIFMPTHRYRLIVIPAYRDRPISHADASLPTDRHPGVSRPADQSCRRIVTDWSSSRRTPGSRERLDSGCCRN